MERSLLIVLSITLLCSQLGCSGSDPKQLFEAKIAGLEERIKPVFTTESGATLINTTYDIEKTDSVVSPFTAVTM